MDSRINPHLRKPVRQAYAASEVCVYHSEGSNVDCAIAAAGLAAALIFGTAGIIFTGGAGAALMWAIAAQQFGLITSLAGIASSCA